jgi:glycosyltransferase involved in cell wall biosynthesis
MLAVFNLSPTRSVLDALLRWPSHTDITYMRRMLPRIGEHVPLAFGFNDSVLEAIKFDSARLMRRYWRSARSTSAASYPRYQMPAGVRADVVYAFGCGVAGRPAVPVVYQDVFAPFWLETDEPGKAIDYKHGVIDLAAVITTWTEHSAAVFRQRFPQHAQKMRVVPPFLPGLVRCLMTPAQKASQSRPEVRFVFVGTQARRKGLDTVLAAWERLAPAVKQWAHLTVCSRLADGNVRIPPDVEHRGYESNLPEVLKRSDVLVMPSRREAYGFVYAEAAASSCAIIATDDPTRRSMLPASGTLFVTPGETDQIAEAIRSCIEDRRYLQAAQQAQHEHALKTWEPRRVAELHYQAFRAAAQPLSAAQPAA